MIIDVTPTFDHDTGQFIVHPDSVGLMGREAIYYGAESFYLHQFPRFSRLRHREDATWLLQKADITPWDRFAMLFDSRHASTARLAQSMIATRYRNPRRIGR